MSHGLAAVGWIDWALLALLLVSTLVGLLRGLIYEVMALAGWVLAYVAAHAFGAALAPAIPVGAPGSGLNLAVAFVAVFVGTLIVWNLLSWLIKKLVQASPLQPFDRVLGALFGLLRGLLVALVLATAVNFTPLARSQAWQASRGAAALGVLLAELRPLLPAAVARHLPA